jgi:hypothetical protein
MDASTDRDFADDVLDREDALVTQVTAEQIPEADRAYQLHCMGHSLRTIARMLGRDKNTVHAWIKEIQAELAPEHKKDRKRWTVQAVERFNALYRAAWTHYLSTDDMQALNTAKACEAEIAKLRGLYTADVVKHEVTGKDGQGIKVDHTHQGHIEFSYEALVAEVTSGPGGDSAEER